MNEWTPAMVEERLEEAACVLRRLPAVRVQGYFSLWPRMKVEFSDLVGREQVPLRLPPPSARAITRMEEAVLWLQWLEPDDAKLAWMRAERLPWKAVCWQFGISRMTANRRWAYCLALIAWRLNRRAGPSVKLRRSQLVRRMTAAQKRGNG